MWIYSQTSGKISINNDYIATGYAGNGIDKNKHESQSSHNHGPLPVGLYDIGPAYTNPRTGPITMNLTPDINNEMFNRDEFRIHPDSIKNPGNASDGCICLDELTRITINNSKDKKLVVIP